jgi:hypothetical protein
MPHISYGPYNNIYSNDQNTLFHKITKIPFITKMILFTLKSYKYNIPL